MEQKKYKQPVDLIQCDQGVCQVIHPDSGMPTEYSVRGLRRYAKEHTFEYTRLVEVGVIAGGAIRLPELPNNWDVKYERPDIMGRELTKVSDYVSEAKKRHII